MARPTRTALHASTYDLVLMDWRMPGMNGDEATQRIHQDAGIRHQPRIVMITAYGREDVMRLSEQAGVDGFLIKPVSPSTLLDTILSVLGRGRIFGEHGEPRTQSAALTTSCDFSVGCSLGAYPENWRHQPNQTSEAPE